MGSNPDCQPFLFQGDKLAFNIGREIFVYPYRGVKKAADLTKPLDKRVYKGTLPTCHDFGCVAGDKDKEGSTAGKEGDEVLPLLVGFSQGQIQLVDPIKKELSKLYNEEVRTKGILLQ